MEAKLERINVIAVFAGFRMDACPRKITPLRFLLPTGEKHKVQKIRRVYTERNGDTRHIHFVVQTDQQRFFDIVYDSKEMSWLLLLELDKLG